MSLSFRKKALGFLLPAFSSEIKFISLALFGSRRVGLPTTWGVLSFPKRELIRVAKYK